ncbi:hypothetical protein M2444_002321 [Paenibacillus sp. PastF-3]|uniref:hypothetical protein n=1 Tax=Paenibacillus sp. PastF-3 TaxID=2940626 RepID=UPI0024755A8B|nr:hypothetical protein [Paenibacillus sp. PastF-3]MDH6370541.1 hypothetical protein [Paenibacillus sp. PastF-3]
MALTAGTHTKMKNWLQNLISHGTYRIGSAITIMPIQTITQVGDVITVQFYLADNVNGTINRFQIIDKDGEVFDDQPDSITKPALNGLLVTFKYTITRV